MGIHIKDRPDYGYLFDHMNRQNQKAGNIFTQINLTEYNSIKSGAYSKAVKSYFAKQEAEGNDISNIKDPSKDILKNDLFNDIDQKKLNQLSADISDLQGSAEKLINKGSDQLFQKINGEYDSAKIYDAVKDFVNQYNDFRKAAENSGNTNVEAKLEGFESLFQLYSKELESVGIKINSDTKEMSLDQNVFLDSDMDKIKRLFQGNSSFAYALSTRASFVGVEVNSELNRMKNYGSNGQYANSNQLGNLWNSTI